MASLKTKKILKTIGLYNTALNLKRKLVYVENAFMPLTPHLLIAVSKAIRWCESKGLAEKGDYLEFGIFRGFTMWYAQALASDMGMKRMKFFGFDSFFGLPAVEGLDAGGEFREGAYVATRPDVEKFLTNNGIDWKRTNLIEGWFDKTLNDRTAAKSGIGKSAICVVDCDLYTSTVTVLDFIGPRLLDQSIILFDDWRSYEDSSEKGEQLAFKEFLAKNPHLSAEPFIEFGGHGKGFVMRVKDRKS